MLMMAPLWPPSVLVVRRGKAGSREAEGDGEERVNEQRT